MTITQERTDPSDVESDDAPAWRGAAVSAPIIGHAHSAADGRKLIRHYAHEALAPADQETAAESCSACQRNEVRTGLCGGCDAAVGAEAAAAALAGMPRNAGVLVHEADQLGCDGRQRPRPDQINPTR